MPIFKIIFALAQNDEIFTSKYEFANKIYKDFKVKNPAEMSETLCSERHFVKF